jgi:hypothetical protein
VNSMAQEREVYVPIPANIRSVIKFCTLGNLASNYALGKLNKALDRLRSVNDLSVLRAGLLKDTARRIPSVKVRALKN